MLTAFEGTVDHPYWDQAHVLTVCTGHAVRSSERAVFPLGVEIDESVCEALLRGDVAGAERDVNRFVEVSLTQNMFDALVDIQFNTGALTYPGSTLLRLLNEGDYVGAANEMLRWNHIRDPKTGKLVEDPGLTARREGNRRLFLAGYRAPDVTAEELAALVNRSLDLQFQLSDLLDVLTPQRSDEAPETPRNDIPTNPDPAVLPRKRES